MMRQDKLTHEEELELSNLLLELDEKYFEIEHVKINLNSNFDNSEIVKCEKYNVLVPKLLTTTKNGKIVCTPCYIIF
jgi:formylmethanofuran dehydrogenase subunit E